MLDRHKGFTRTACKLYRPMTYNAPEYIVGRGGTADLLILFISACISCKSRKSPMKVQVMIKLDFIKNMICYSQML